MPYRINRIRQMLDEKDVFSVDDFKRMVTDQHSNYAALLTPFILTLNDRKNDLTPAESGALDDLSGWDYNMSADQKSWKWGDIHKITIEHPLGQVKLLDRIFNLNSDTYRVGGSNHTVCPYSYKEGFKVNNGASERHIFNTANWDESLTVIPTGASGIPASEFYLSQTRTYLEGKFYKDAFSDGAVKAAVKYTLKLLPEK